MQAQSGAVVIGVGRPFVVAEMRLRRDPWLRSMFISQPPSLSVLITVFVAVSVEAASSVRRTHPATLQAAVASGKLSTDAKSPPSTWSALPNAPSLTHAPPVICASRLLPE